MCPADNSQHTTTAVNSGSVKIEPYAWLVFALTCVMMMFDFADRQVIAAVLPYLKDEWSLNDRDLALLTAIVSIVVSLGAIPMGVIIDRWSRTKSIAIMGITWSLASIASGLATNFWQMFAFRTAIGAGEAGYGPGAAALLANYFPSKVRGTVIGCFNASAAMGAMFGVACGGFIASRWGWRSALGILGFPGIILGAVFFLIKDYETVSVTAPSEQTTEHRLNPDFSKRFRLIFSQKLNLLAFAVIGFQGILGGACSTWMPSYFSRTYALPADKAGLLAAVFIFLAAVGNTSCGYFSDLLCRRLDLIRGKIIVAVVCGVGATFFGALGYGMAPGLLSLSLIAMSALFCLGHVAPLYTLVLELVQPGLRATAYSIIIVFQGIVGYGFGSFAAGSLSDRFGLQNALLILSFTPMLASLPLLRPLSCQPTKQLT